MCSNVVARDRREAGEAPAIQRERKKRRVCNVSRHQRSWLRRRMKNKKFAMKHARIPQRKEKRDERRKREKCSESIEKDKKKSMERNKKKKKKKGNDARSKKKKECKNERDGGKWTKREG